VYKYVSAGTPVLRVSATDVECTSCITYSLEPADEHSAFVIDSHTGQLLYSPSNYSTWQLNFWLLDPFRIVV